MGVSPEAISGSFRSETFEAIFYPDTNKRQKTITPCFFLKKAKGADSFPTFYGPMTKGKLGEPDGHVKCFPKIFLNSDGCSDFFVHGRYPVRIKRDPSVSKGVIAPRSA
jgi:hypothetical protein